LSKYLTAEFITHLEYYGIQSPKKGKTGDSWMLLRLMFVLLGVNFKHWTTKYGDKQRWPGIQMTSVKMQSQRRGIFIQCWSRCCSCCSPALTLPCHHSPSDSQSTREPLPSLLFRVYVLLFTIAHFYTYFFKVNNMIFAVYAARRVHKSNTSAC